MSYIAGIVSGPIAAYTADRWGRKVNMSYYAITMWVFLPAFSRTPYLVSGLTSSCTGSSEQFSAASPVSLSSKARDSRSSWSPNVTFSVLFPLNLAAADSCFSPYAVVIGSGLAYVSLTPPPRNLC